MMKKHLLCYKYIIDLIFPNRCPCCGKFIKYDELICKDCIDELPVMDKYICDKCGKPECICYKKLWYDRCFVTSYYEGKMRDGIINLKYKSGINLAEYFCPKLVRQIKKAGLTSKIDIVTGVPMTKGSLAVRQYNQANEIANIISQLINKPCSNKILKKKYNNVSQHTLSSKDRQKATIGLYSLAKGADVKGKTILLCDDVITTASTLNECAKVLKKAGAKCVICVALATTSIKRSENNV